MSKPSIILCPGAWYPVSTYDSLIAQLGPRGYECEAVAFPSLTRPTEVSDLRPDIDAVRSAVLRQVSSGREVIVVSHSYSGLPVSSALDGLGRMEREKNGLAGGVIKIIYLAAFLAKKGQSVMEVFGGQSPPWLKYDLEKGTDVPEDGCKFFFHDVPEGEKWAAQMLPHASVAKNSPATSAAYLDIPSVYVLCDDDQATPVFFQQKMVDDVRSEGAMMETEKINTSHSSFMANPSWVAALIRRTAGEQL